MTTYKEQQEKKMSYVLLKNCEVIGTYGNLRKLVEHMENTDFPSYWTLVRKDFPISFDSFKIYKVRHY